MRLFDIAQAATPGAQPPRPPLDQAPTDPMQVTQPLPAPRPFLETEPAVMPYLPTTVDIPL